MGKKGLELKILGRVSKDLVLKYKNVLNYSDRNLNEVILFCDYSNFNIPVGHIFDEIGDKNGVVLFFGKIVLRKVSQEFALSYGLIPKGHKSICEFEFIESNLPEAINDLSVITDWYESKRFLIFR